MTDHKLTDLQLAIIGVLTLGPATAKQIAELLERKPRSVATALTHMRGANVVHDGSSAKRVGSYRGIAGLNALLAGDPPNSHGYAHSRGAKPIMWTLRHQSEWETTRL